MAQTPSLLSIISHPEVLNARLNFLKEGSGVLKRYSSLISAVQEREFEPVVNKYVVRQARDAEAWLRRALHVGLDSLNELFDSGAMSAFFARAKAEEFRPVERFGKIFSSADSALDGIDRTMLETGMDLLRQYVPRARISAESMDLVFHGDDSKEVELHFRVNPRSGSRARMTPDEFFSGTRPGSIVFRAPAKDDCHHKRSDSRVAGLLSDPDLYGAMISTMARTRESMYEHVKEVEEVGFPVFSGGAGLAVSIVIAALIFLIFALTTTAIVLQVQCEKGAKSKCDLAFVFGIVAAILTLIGGFIIFGGKIGGWHTKPLLDPDTGRMAVSVN